MLMIRLGYLLCLFALQASGATVDQHTYVLSSAPYHPPADDVPPTVDGKNVNLCPWAADWTDFIGGGGSYDSPMHAISSGALGMADCERILMIRNTSSDGMDAKETQHLYVRIAGWVAIMSDAGVSVTVHLPILDGTNEIRKLLCQPDICEESATFEILAAEYPEKQVLFVGKALHECSGIPIENAIGISGVQLKHVDGMAVPNFGVESPNDLCMNLYDLRLPGYFEDQQIVIVQVTSYEITDHGSGAVAFAVPQEVLDKFCHSDSAGNGNVPFDCRIHVTPRQHASAEQMATIYPWSVSGVETMQFWQRLGVLLAPHETLQVCANWPVTPGVCGRMPETACPIFVENLLKRQDFLAEPARCGDVFELDSKFGKLFGRVVLAQTSVSHGNPVINVAAEGWPALCPATCHYDYPPTEPDQLCKETPFDCDLDGTSHLYVPLCAVYHTQLLEDWSKQLGGNLPPDFVVSTLMSRNRFMSPSSYDCDNDPTCVMCADEPKSTASTVGSAQMFMTPILSEVHYQFRAEERSPEGSQSNVAASFTLATGLLLLAAA